MYKFICKILIIKNTTQFPEVRMYDTHPSIPHTSYPYVTSTHTLSCYVITLTTTDAPTTLHPHSEQDKLSAPELVL